MGHTIVMAAPIGLQVLDVEYEGENVRMTDFCLKHVQGQADID